MDIITSFKKWRALRSLRKLRKEVIRRQGTFGAIFADLKSLQQYGVTVLERIDRLERAIRENK